MKGVNQLAVGKVTAVLIANYLKNGIDGYIGANTLMEAAMGHTLGVPVYFLFPIGAQGCQLEAESIATGVWNGRISLTNSNQ